jgi:hypothetical protein
MSETMNMRRLLGTEGGPPSPLSAEDKEVLLRGHLETTSYASARELQGLQTVLQDHLAKADASPREPTGQAVLRSLRSLRLDSSVPTPSLERLGEVLAECTTLDPPQFTIQSAQQVAHNSAGDVVRFTRANASARTLEVTAATGEFGGVRWPSSETFIFGFNRSQASIGGVLTLPPHGAGAVLFLSVQLGVDQVLFGGETTPGTASSLLNVIKGDGDLPLRGTAVGWCRARLSFHGAQGSAGASVEFVSEWVNRDGAESHDRAPGGIVNLSTTVAPAPATSILSVFVDVTCFAAAEETAEQFKTGFALFECRNKAVTEINGIYVPPSRLRVRQVTARLCEVPVLVQDGPAMASG